MSDEPLTKPQRVCENCDPPEHGNTDHAYQSHIDYDVDTNGDEVQTLVHTYGCKVCSCLLTGEGITFTAFQVDIKHKTGLTI